MNSLKTHIGFIVPLVCLLFSVQFTFFIDNILKDYQKIMKSNYSIVLLSKKDLSGSEDIKDIKAISEIAEIDPDSVIKKLNGQISPQSLEKLRASLPKFYDVKLSFFPNQKELKSIQNSLEKVDGVSKVEIFSKAHDSIYNIFYLSKEIIYIFTALIIILGIILMFKQIKIWLYEHRDRIEILNLFGAPFLFKSSILYKMAFIDSIISTVIVGCFYWLIAYNEFFINFMNQISLATKPLHSFMDILVLLAISIALSIISVTLVMIRALKTRY